MKDMNTNKDKAGEELWTTLWKTHDLPDPIKTNSINPNNYIYKRMHEYIQNVFSKNGTRYKKLLEIGCANSVWLPYFAKEYNLDITGLDYSEYGCEQARKILERDNVEGKIVNADFFNPPEDLINQFDYLFSIGVVEHFEDTSDTLKELSKFLKPGGIIITQIPNTTSLEGNFHKWFNKEFYDVHNIMDKNDLIDAHKKAGFEILDSCYLVSISFYVNLYNKGRKVKFYPIKKIITYSLSSLAKFIWLIESYAGSLPTSQILSPIIFVVGKKPI